MTRIIAPCATCGERIMRVEALAIARCSVYKDGIPTAIIKCERKCGHRNIQTLLDGNARTRLESCTRGVSIHRYYRRG